MLVIGGIQVAGGLYAANAQYQQGRAESQYYQYQAAVERQKGSLALATGEKQSELIQDTAKIEGKQLKTAQAESNASTRAAMAANGVSGVTSEDITTSNLSKERLDELALKYNADTKSWEAKTQAQNANWTAQANAGQLDYASSYAKKAGRANAFSSLLSSAGQVANTWLSLRR